MSQLHSISLKTLLLCGLGYGSVASAAWVSGGGELIKDANNPWFLSNTTDVTYCVSVDESAFSASREDIETAVDHAFTFWKEEFSVASIPMQRDAEDGKIVRIVLATQNFIRTSCKETTDIHFQFGTLTSEQLNHLKDPRNFVGIAVRTDYDPVNLRGKGFVYISPDKGPWRFNLENAIEQPWKEEQRLLGVVIHEVGHIFGITHTKDFSLMAAEYPEYSITKGPTNFRGPMSVTSGGSHFFHMPMYGAGDIQGCYREVFARDKVRAFFDISQSENCIRFSLLKESDSGHFVLSAYAGPQLNDSMPKVGEAVFEQSKYSDPEMDITVVLNPQQKVLPPTHRLNNLWMGPLREFETLNGVFHNKLTGLKRPMAILGSDRFLMHIVGEMDGEVVTSLFD